MQPVLTESLESLRASRTSAKWHRFGPSVVPAWVAEMDAQPCPAVVEATTAALERGDTGYTTIEPYAVAMSQFAAERWSLAWDPGAMVAAPDVMLGVRELIRVFTNPDDAIIISPPVYDAFYGFIRAENRRVVAANLSDEGRLDETELDSAFGQATRSGKAAYLLCNPHNPTGTVHTASELSMLAAVGRAHGVRIVSDEIHAPLTLADAQFTSFISVPGGEAGISVVSASKGWNLAGLKCALLMPGEQAAADLARVPEVARHGASHVAAIAHEAALREGRPWLDQLRDELLRNRQHLATRLAQELPSARYRPGAATYLAWIDLSAYGLGPDAASTLRRRVDLALSPGQAYRDGAGDFVRLNFATSPSVLDEVIDRLVQGCLSDQ